MLYGFKLAVIPLAYIFLYTSTYVLNAHNKHLASVSAESFVMPEFHRSQQVALARY